MGPVARRHGPAAVEFLLAEVEAPILAQGNDGYDVFESHDFTSLATSHRQSLADYPPTADLTTGSTAYQPRDDVANRTRIIPVQ